MVRKRRAVVVWAEGWQRLRRGREQHTADPAADVSLSRRWVEGAQHSSCAGRALRSTCLFSAPDVPSSRTSAEPEEVTHSELAGKYIPAGKERCSQAL